MLSRFWMTSIQFTYLRNLKEKTLEVTLFYKWDKEVFFRVYYEINLEIYIYMVKIDNIFLIYSQNFKNIKVSIYI